jgi:hypothetical protein
MSEGVDLRREVGDMTARKAGKRHDYREELMVVAQFWLSFACDF